MNQIIIHGRLVRDPELKTAASGNEFCKFTVAVDRRRKEDPTDFFDCTAFGKTGVAISKYLTKGREILVQGRMESNKVEKDGQTRTYWGINVETFDFCGGQGGSTPSADAPASDGFTAVPDPEGLPF